MAKRLINQNTNGRKETYAGGITSAGGIEIGELYHTSGVVKIRLT